MEVKIPEAYHLVAIYYFDSDSRRPVELYLENGLDPSVADSAYRIASAVMDGREDIATDTAVHSGLYYVVIQPGSEETVVLVFTV